MAAIAKKLQGIRLQVAILALLLPEVGLQARGLRLRPGSIGLMLPIQRIRIIEIALFVWGIRPKTLANKPDGKVTRAKGVGESLGIKSFCASGNTRMGDWGKSAANLLSFRASNARFRDRTSLAKDCRAKEHLRSSAQLERTGPLQPVVRPVIILNYADPYKSRRS